jgi:hypothetical protein
VREHRPPEGAEHDPEGEEQRVVRRGQRRQEPGEAEQRQQGAEARLGPASRCVEAGTDEAPSDDWTEDRPHGAIREVIAGDDEREVREPGEERRGGDDQQARRN